MKAASPNQRTIDLHPSEWRSADRPPREPFFGPSALGFVITFSAWLIVSTAVHAVINPRPASHSLPPGAYSWTPENGLTRLP